MSAYRILVVEDDPLSALLARDVLELAGNSVRTAGTVQEAQARLADETPDLVILDVQIPGGGGEAVLRQIRTRPCTAALPVVAVTAFAMAGDRQRFLAMGFDGYLAKPIDTHTFASAVTRFVGESGRPRADGRDEVPR